MLHTVRTLVAAVALVAVGASCPAQQEAMAPNSAETVVAQKEKAPMLIMETSLGNVTIELWPDKAPVTVENFLKYVDEKFFDGTIFHRVIPGFVIQGGGMTAQMSQKKTHAPIKNEATNGEKNLRGTLSMARTQVVDSATSQFFVSLKDNGFLDHTSPTPQGFGYAVFGKVVKGMDVIDKIAQVKTGNHGMHQDVPVEPVLIKSLRRASDS